MFSFEFLQTFATSATAAFAHGCLGSRQRFNIQYIFWLLLRKHLNKKQIAVVFHTQSKKTRFRKSHILLHNVKRALGST